MRSVMRQLERLRLRPRTLHSEFVVDGTDEAPVYPPVPSRWPERLAWAWGCVVIWCGANQSFLGGLGASALIHAVLAIALAVLLFAGQKVSPGINLNMEFGHEEAGSEGFEFALDPKAFELPDTITQDADLMAATQTADQISLVASTSQGTGGSTNTGGGAGDADVASGASFLGAAATGKRFIFVVDASGSMEGRRFNRAKAELIRSINNMKGDQQFYVYFFNDLTIPLFSPRPAHGLVEATPANKARAVRWVRLQRAESLTNPDLAIQEALGMKPDAIFFLTDGEVEDPEILKTRIGRINSDGVVIHTIAFEDPAGAGTLQAIAESNHGTFRFVK